MSMSNDAVSTPAAPRENLVLLIGEALVPGGSHLLKGDVREGVVNAILGVAATAAWGFPGRLLIAASSYSKATTGKRIYQHLLGDGSQQPAPVPPST